jgi:dephospho-CoA kinase
VVLLKVCILAGMPGAGKEEFVKVAQEVGYKVIRMGDVVRSEATKRGIPDDDQGVGGFAHSERQLHGYDVWARRTIPFIKDVFTIVDGCRGKAELDVFRREFNDNVLVIAIHSSPHTRFERLRTRDRNDAPRNWNDFMQRELRELGWGLGKVIALADIMIVNEGTLDQFRERVRKALSGLK